MQAIRNTKLYKQAKPFQPQHFGLEWIFRWRTVREGILRLHWTGTGCKATSLVFFNKLLTVIQLESFSLTLQKKLPVAMHVQALSLLQKVKLSQPE